MKIEDLREMRNPDHADIQACHDIICALEDRLQLAKELIVQSGDWKIVEDMDYHVRKNAFIAKLQSEGL